MGNWAVLAVGLALGQDAAPESSAIDVAVQSISGIRPPSAWTRMDDIEFIHRVWFDLAGEKPSDEEVRMFTADPGPAKRSKKVDELLASPRFGEFWGKRLAEAFIGEPDKFRMDRIPGLSTKAGVRIRDRYVKWLAEQVNKDRPYPEIVSEMLTATGKSDAVPALGYKLSFFRGGGYPQEFAEGMSRGLLGVRLYCARCHDHPFDRWRVEDYYGLAAFVVREKASRAGFTDEAELATASSGDMEIPVSLPGQNPDPKVKLAQTTRADPIFLFGGAAGKDDDRVKVLANLVTSKANTQLPRALANRVWGWIFRRGVVHPVDDFNLRNKAASPALLDVLTRQFSSSGSSLKALIRTICLTRIYQVADAKGPSEENAFYLRGVCSKPLLERPLPKNLPKVSWPADWVPDRRVQGWPYFHYRVPDKEKKSIEARLYVIKSPTAVEFAFGQLVGAKPKIEKIQGRQEIVLGDGTGTMYCDSRAGAPLENERLIYARVGKAGGWTFRLEGPADTVGDWREEFIEILKGIEP